MLGFVYPSLDELKFKNRRLITLQFGELEDFDFTEASEHIYRVLSLLSTYNIVPSRYGSSEEILEVIDRLVSDLDNEDSSEFGNLRVELCDDLFSLEIYIGV